MTKTKISKQLKQIRLNNGENLKVMADKLEVTSAFLSAIENGKKNMPESLLQKIGKVYSLSKEETDELRNSALESQKTISINMEKSNSQQRELAVCFARQFNDIDEDTNKQIMEILSKRRKK